MPPVNNLHNGSKYWRSLEEYSTTGEFTAFVEKNFPTEAELLQPSTRRRFLQVMGASMALAGLTSCRWPKEKIYPHANRPDGISPGVPVKFATSMEINGVGSGLLATSYDGRPIKIDGNPSDPNSKGASCIHQQAGVLELYDPDRSTSIIRFDNNHEIQTTLSDFKAYSSDLFGKLKDMRGKGLYFLTESSSSESLKMMKKRAQTAFPDAKWYEYEPISDQHIVDGSNIAFGTPLRTQLDLTQAEIIVSIDDDLLGVHPNAIRYSSEFAQRRSPESGSMNRLYSIESHFSATGALADHRLPLKPSDIESFVFSLAKAILNRPELNKTSDFQAVRNAIDTAPDLDNQPHAEYLQALVSDLLSYPGKSVLTAGINQPSVVHTIVHTLNSALGNTGSGKPVNYTRIDSEHTGHTSSIQSLAEDLKSGKVNTLVMIGGNPVYDAPVDLAFSELLSTATHKIQLSLVKNESTPFCDWHINRAHYLESWGDTRGYDGTHYLSQPLIAPLYDGLSAQEFLALLSGEALNRGYDIVRQMVKEEYAPSDLASFIRKGFHSGMLDNSAYQTDNVELKIENIEAELKRKLSSSLSNANEASNPSLELSFMADPSVLDGRFSNNGWLQEVPDFITKLTWDNAAYISIHTAHELHIQHGEMIRIKHGEREIEIAAYHLPGMPHDTLALPLGYGRTEAGKVGNGTGFNVYPLRTVENMYAVTGVEVHPTGKSYTLACTQDHFTIDNLGFNERQARIKTLIREADLNHYQEHPDFAQHVGHALPDVHLWKQFEYTDYKWGMSIDLNACTGCNACVVSCQAENNIPVVGKDEVNNGREMQWIRIDRYFKGEPDAPEVVQQPLACVHCENAPCEQVCPVAATVHDDEGLNVMVYNRCIGTRYCSNNCPFKVRRFNFFWNHKDKTEVEQMVYNPEVTVRTRGVMEKCTYCVQRIQQAKIVAKNENRRVRDGELTTACQDSCPTKAIAFGDLNDPNSTVSKLHENSRSYTLLDELMVKPRTAYLARVRNPNPALAKEHDSSEPSHES